MTIDIFTYLKYLQTERFRLILIHANPESHRLMTEFLKTISSKFDGHYFDLLDCFIQNDLDIETFTPEEFWKLIIENSRGKTLFVVDRLDFLMDAWNQEIRSKFIRSFSNQWDSFKDSMKASLIMGCETYPLIENVSILDSHGQKKVYRLSEFNDIV